MIDKQANQSEAWVDLSPDDERELLVALIGNTFGEQPEQQIETIRESRKGFANRFANMAKIKQSDTVLEVGSGCGFGTRVLSEKASQVWACDISPAYLAFASKECADLKNIKFRQIKSRCLSEFGDNSVDVVVSISVFIHLNLYDMYCYFKEFSRVIRTGGYVCFDFADSDKLFRRDWLRPKNGDSRKVFFKEQVEHYRNDPKNLFQLMQWNSKRGIINIAQACGFKFIRRRSDRLLFIKQFE